MDFDHSVSDDDNHHSHEDTLKKARESAGSETDSDIKEHWQWTKHQQLWRRLFRGITGQGRWKTGGCHQRSKKQENSWIMIVVIMIVVIFRIVWQLPRYSIIQCNKENRYSLDCITEKIHYWGNTMPVKPIWANCLNVIGTLYFFDIFHIR